MLRAIAIVNICVLATSVTPAQSTAPVFEVASVKSSVPGTQGGRMQFLPGGRFSATNTPLNYLIQRIYDVRDFQLVGDPKWMSIVADGYSARYDIQATGDAAATEAQVKEMVRNLLAERFGLKVHKENRDMPVYALIPARTGIKLAAAADNGRPRGTGGVAFMVPGWIEGNNVSISGLMSALAQLVDRPVVDRTNFAEAFDFRLTFTPLLDTPASPGTPPDWDCEAAFAAFQEKKQLKRERAGCPSLFTAVQEQLGLKLDPQKAPVEVLAIDQVQRPSAN